MTDLKSCAEQKVQLQLRELILNARRPIVLRDFKTNWKCFGTTLEEWCLKYDNATGGKDINFERMYCRQGSTPQWEYQRQQLQDMTMEQFIKEHVTNATVDEEPNYWTGLNYKRAAEVPLECRADVNFECFGFPEASDYATYWLSSKGANTPCHYDTYGCNVVVQVFGSKSWLLFPPETPLTCTRIPYEESSIYCEENFYAPQQMEIGKFCKKLGSFVYHYVLQAGDVLIVPRHWWHYVETVETSLSVNVWIPLDVDLEAQVEECIVKFIMESFARDSDTTTRKVMLNPNQLTEMTAKSELYEILLHLLQTWKAQQYDNDVGPATTKKSKQKTYSYQSLTEREILYFKELSAFQLEPLEEETFTDLLMNNAKRFDASFVANESSNLYPLEKALINSICSPSIVEKIKREFFKRFTNESKLLN